jgi:ubiquinone biosynthesis protein COQ9
LQLVAGMVEIAKSNAFVYRIRIGFILVNLSEIITIALKHVPFDGWSEKIFKLACNEANISEVKSKLLFPRGSIDLMLAFISSDNQKMTELIKIDKNHEKKYRDRVTDAIIKRIIIADLNKEAMRKAISVLSLPHMFPDNAAMIWNTSDAIWNALDDSSQDINWYTKRTTLAWVYSSTILYWLGDESKDLLKTKEFVNRRIDEVMEFESIKMKFKMSKVGKEFLKGAEKVFSLIKAPTANTNL